jgi:cystathionine gamma-lyase
MKDFGGMISIVLKNASLEDTFKLASSFQCFALAESLGRGRIACQSSGNYDPCFGTKSRARKVGVVDNLLRLSVGVEDVEDLLEDLKQALG